MIRKLAVLLFLICLSCHVSIGQKKQIIVEADDLNAFLELEKELNFINDCYIKSLKITEGSSNWIFMRHDTNSKDSLLILLKNFKALSAQMSQIKTSGPGTASGKNYLEILMESLNKSSKSITTLLAKKEDYEDIEKNFEAQNIYETEMLPTISLIKKHLAYLTQEKTVRLQEYRNKFEKLLKD